MVRLIKEEFYDEQYYSILRKLREYLNSELRYENINGIKFRVGDIYDISSKNACAFEVKMQDESIYLRESYVKIVSSEDLYANDLILYAVDDASSKRFNYKELSRFGAGEKLLNILKDIASSIPEYYDGGSFKARIYQNESINNKKIRRKNVNESNQRRRYYDPELDQFEIYLMTRGTDGQDEIRDYVESRRDTGVFGSIGSEHGSISVWVDTTTVDDDFVNEVEDLIIFAQDCGARLNTSCYNELKDLFTVKHAPYDI